MGRRFLQGGVAGGVRSLLEFREGVFESRYKKSASYSA